MPLSWNEIKHRAIAFSKDWRDETREDAEAKSFWDAFFHVFGVQRRTVASFEEPVRKLSGDWAYIDLFWPGTLLAEHKSAGRDLGKAHAQGMGYIRALATSGREKETPRYLIVSDFQRIAIHDLEPEQDPDLPLFQRLPPSFEFPLADFHKHIRHFFFIAGYRQHKLNPEDPANEDATQLMCDLHDALEEGEFGTDDTGRAGHELKQFLVRLLFCLFAEDNGIFPTRAFQLYIQDHTAPDGSDLGPMLGQLFDVLNTPEDRRQKNLDPDLLQFAYINGDLYRERLALPAFTSAMRAKLLACAAFDWSRISPAVFGSLFQAVMDAKERRQIGAHYTAERNILKVVRSLFLDESRAEFTAAKRDKSGRGKSRLTALQKKLASLRFLDPACGCGNFLVITYRELRTLELEILMELHTGQQQMGEADVFNLSLIDVDQMFGIEIEEFPARIAEVALWLTDHQANVRLSEVFGQFYKRIPLRKSPHIHVANALRLDWRTVLPTAECSYILGNPPFVGKSLMSPEQRADMEAVWGGAKGAGVLDFVTAWYVKAAQYLTTENAMGSARVPRVVPGVPPGTSNDAQNTAPLPESGEIPQTPETFRRDAEKNTRDACATQTRVAFVSTNSISQGEQVSILWGTLLSRYRVKIHFAHRTFAWESEAWGKAHVHVVIIGFGLGDVPEKRLYDYEADAENPTVITANNISPYLIEGSNTILPKRTSPICNVPRIVFGSMPNDGGHLLLSKQDKVWLADIEPDAVQYLRPFVGAEEFINGAERWCLWLDKVNSNLLRKMPVVWQRVQAVYKHRLASTRPTTKLLAASSHCFGENRQPDTNYLLIPGVSSEDRPYIPIGFLSPKIVASNLVNIIPGATLYHFGVLSSAMHMAWVRQVCGRLKSDFRYSNQIVYNNFPWPENATDTHRARIEEAAQRVLDLRVECGDGRHGFLPVLRGKTSTTLAGLYHRNSMPKELIKAHRALDLAVDRGYRSEAFPSDRTRVEYLFALYEKIIAPLMPPARAKKKRSPKSA